MARTCECVMLGAVGFVHLVLLTWCVVGFANIEWESCYASADIDTIDRYLPTIYNSFGLVPLFLAVIQASADEDRYYREEPAILPAALGLLVQTVYVGFYCFVSTTICHGSDAAFAVWIMLGAIQAIYFVCAVARLLSRLCT